MDQLMDQPIEHPALTFEELMEHYNPVKPKIEARLMDFRRIWENASDEEIFSELAFCLLTPQSKARTCWRAVERLCEKKMMTGSAPAEISSQLTGVRFHQRKGEYICLAREMFRSRSLRDTLSAFADPAEAREWLVQNIKGMGYKEASHFLRNIGIGENLAILDRHILKNLLLLGVIDEIPASLTKRTYLVIEGKMAAFSSKTKIPMGHLDLLLWYKEAGEVFK
ncbi:MAG: N-glycosylase/DNA lyase [Methanosaeta sp. PtaU1.Bin112]|nr:MAG: N-glycosylase/DNA lyase [Methanosaeta sp. PtaU1.Bin112]